MINLIKSSWPYALAFCIGFYFVSLIFGAEIKQQQIDYLNEKKTLIEENQKTLNESILANEQLNIELMEKKEELATQSEEFKGNIDEAIKNDGSSFSGIGANSLQLYKKALGYHPKSKATSANDKGTN